MTPKLQVLKKLEDWSIALQPALRQFPKSVRFTIGQRIENTTFECVDYVIRANLDKTRRKDHLFQARVSCQRLLVLIRLARAQSFIDGKRYESYAENLTEIAKMLSGWARVS